MREALASQPLAAREIQAFIETSMALHFWDRMDDAAFAAVLSAYGDALADVPGVYAREAFRLCNKELSRKPTPGDVRSRAKQMMHQARERLRVERAPEPLTREGPDLTPEERRAIAERAAAEFPMLGAPKRKRGFLGPVAT